MKDVTIAKLLITETGHRPTQFKKINDIFCADKNFQGLDEVLRIGINLVESDFMPKYPNVTQWSSTEIPGY